jgi:ubiquitin
LQEYGDIFSIRLGATDCVVVNNLDLRDEVLISKANDFDGRPHFERFRILFGGDKQNGKRNFYLRG